MKMDEDFIPTRGSLVKPQNSINYQSVEYKSYKSKKKEHKFDFVPKVSTTNSNEFNIKKAKHEVVRYGMSGFDSQKKEEAKVQLAIKLGAKPPKNKYKNYKVLKEERAKQKIEENLKSQLQQIGKNSEGKSVAKSKAFNRKLRKNKDGILDIYGKVKVVNKDQ